MDKENQLEVEKEYLNKLFKLRDFIWEYFDTTDDIYNPLLLLAEEAIANKRTDIAILRGCKILKNNRRKKYVFEVERLVGGVNVYINGEKITSLRNKNDSLQAALEACGIEENILAKAEVKEFFDGEQHDMLVTVLKEAMDRSGGFDTRRYEILNGLLEQNEYTGNGRETLEVVKRVLSNGEAISKRDIADLERVGFALVNENTHYKFVYRENERYWFSIAKTPSDRRGGKNHASDIIKRLSVYQ